MEIVMVRFSIIADKLFSTFLKYMTKILYIDMDGVLVDFKSVYPKLTAEQRAKKSSIKRSRG